VPQGRQEHLQNKTTQRSVLENSEATMIDVKAMESELTFARQAKLDALAASSDVEDMIVEVQHLDSRPPRLAFFISGFDDDLDPVTN
jgi:hypothetical protein